MKRMIKLIAAVLAVLFIFTALISCKSKKDTESTEVSSAEGGNGSPEENALGLKLLSFNLRYDTTSHPLMATEYRGAHLMEIIDKYKPDSIGFCEATDDWMNFLRDEMKNRGYEYVGVGRDAGKDGPELKGTGNEHTPVFYNTERFDLVEGGNFWLSTLPDQPGSLDWNSACKRVCSFVVLEDKTSGTRFAHFATHLDHVSVEAQYNSVRVIQNKINGIYNKYGNIGVVLSGDLNCVAFEQENTGYIPYTYNFATTYLDDSRVLAKEKGVDGSTWSGYQNPADWEKGRKSDNDKPAVDTATAPIDYILLSKGRFDVSYYTVVNDTFTFDYKDQTWHDHPVSDHYGLYAEVSLHGGMTPAGLDESKVIAHEAEISTGTSLPAMPKLYADLVPGAKLTSGLKGSVSALLKDKEMIKPGVGGSKIKKTDMYWELTAALDGSAEVYAVSVKTGKGSAPKWAECFVSKDAVNWEKVGATVTEELKNDTAYTWTLKNVAEAKYVKVVLLSCESDTELDRFAVYGMNFDTGEVALEAVSGPKPGDKEGYEKMIDGDPSTKFYINTSKNTLEPLVFKAESVITPTKYTMTSANDTIDYPDRVPAGWILYGSMDGEKWSVIDDVSDPKMKADKFVTYEYELAVNGIYSYFKLEFKLGSTGKTQIAEFAIFNS